MVDTYLKKKKDIQEAPCIYKLLYRFWGRFIAP